MMQQRQRADATMIIQRAWRFRVWRKTVHRMGTAESAPPSPPSPNRVYAFSAPPSPPDTPDRPGSRFQPWLSRKLSSRIAPLDPSGHSQVRASADVACPAPADDVAASMTKGSRRKLQNIARRTRDQRKPKLDVATVAAAAVLDNKLKDFRWRRPWVVKLRWALSWMFQFAVMGVCFLYSLVIAIKFGDGPTATMVTSWVIAYGCTFAIVEPVQVFILASTPCLASAGDRTLCGGARV